MDNQLDEVILAITGNETEKDFWDYRSKFCRASPNESETDQQQSTEEHDDNE